MTMFWCVGMNILFIFSHLFSCLDNLNDNKFEKKNLVKIYIFFMINLSSLLVGILIPYVRITILSHHFH